MAAVIKRVRGDNYPISIELVQSDGTAFDLTSSTVLFTVKRNLQDSDNDALIKTTTTLHTSPTTGQTDIDMSTANTDIEGEFYYDIKIIIGTQITSVETSKIIFLPHTTIRTS